MDLKDVESLVKLMDDEGLSLIKIEDGKTKVELSRQAGTPMSVAAIPAAAPVVSASPTTPLAEKKEDTSVPTTEAAVVSPMTGTFYASPSPEDPPFVKVGDSVNVGDVVCIVEAMKTFNRLESDISGTVSHILVNAGDPVEEGQPLIVIQ